MSSRLFSPASVGDMALKHRVVMSPMTRFRADDKHIPADIVATYYGQRASVAGSLLITEATAISVAGAGYANIPGIWNDDQIRQWKKATDAVHAKGSFIFCQLWALGRVADAKFMEAKGLSVVGPSSIPPGEDKPAPRELSEDEIQQWIAEYAHAAKCAVEAGFDGVEIHGANGYLVDQFIQDVSNTRTDKWGGSIENRSRFALEVATAIAKAIGPEKVGIRLSPWNTHQAMGMKDMYPQFTDVIEGLRKVNLCYLHLVVGGRFSGPLASSEQRKFAFQAWGDERPMILSGRFKPDTALEAIDQLHKEQNVLIGFGRDWISNPDLPFRLEKNLQLTPYQESGFYSVLDSKGYIDYDFSPEFISSRG